MNHAEPEDYFRKLAMLIRCSEWLERLTAEFYGLLAQKVKSGYVSALMRVISAQSTAHAEAMDTVLKLLGIEDVLSSDEVNCVELTKPVGEATLELMNAVKRSSEINALDYQEILGKLKFLEVGIGEETYHRILQPMLRLLIDNSGNTDNCSLELRSRIASELLDDVARQEELHEKLVIKALKLFEGGKPGQAD